MNSDPAAAVDIRPLEALRQEDTARVAGGYTSPISYRVSYNETAGRIAIELQRTVLDEPYVKHWEFDDADLTHYRQVMEHGYSLGAYDGNLLVGFIIAEPRRWNGSMWVWEFHVAPSHHRQGIGRRLMDTLSERALAEGFRTIVCEAQNTNGVGLDAYHHLGFHVEGVDLSYYTNNDYPDGEIAVFMKRRLG